MSGKTELNLDLHAAKTAQKIISSVSSVNTENAQGTENLITKALGVLQENGVYACILFLYARSMDKNIAEQVRNSLLNMTKEFNLSPPSNLDWNNGLKFVSDSICSDLDKLLLVKQVWEQTLIYARYGAKAWKEAK